MVQIRILCGEDVEPGMRRSFSPFIALAVFFLFLLLACGGGNDQSPPPTNTRPRTQQFEMPYNDTGYGVALDASGNIYITGATGGNLDGNNSQGLLDIFLAKIADLDFSSVRTKRMAQCP
jgi:hypothetical protein